VSLVYNKAMSSELVIEFLIKIRVWKRNINSILTRYGIRIKTSSEYSVYSEITVFDPKTGGFDPFLVIFVSLIICFVFRKIRFWRYTENAECRIRNKPCFEFRKTTKIGIFRLSQGLSLQTSRSLFPTLNP